MLCEGHHPGGPVFRKSCIALAIAAGYLSAPSPARAQTEIYKPYQNLWIWTAPTLYLGASFLKINPGPVLVSLRGNAAGWVGRLYVINPTPIGPAPLNLPLPPDTIPLFTNIEPIGTTVDITTLTRIPIGTELVFYYQVINDWRFFGDANDLLPKYSGPNLFGQRYYSPASSNHNINPNLQFGNRWTVVGRSPTGALEFGFEDMTWSNSDMDFDDVVFQVTGLDMGVYTRDLDRKSLVW